jgi:hypothetical protein
MHKYFPHSETQFIDGFGMLNGKLQPEYGYLKVELVQKVQGMPESKSIVPLVDCGSESAAKLWHSRFEKEFDHVQLQ